MPRLGIGGTITGQVISPYEPGGVGAVTVEAFLIGGKRGDVTSAGTASNGTYQIVGLFPGSYKIAFTDPGFATMWYPGTTSQSSATAVSVPAETTVTNINGDIAGKPGSITGQLLTGETPSPAVSVTPLVDNVPTGSAVTADSSGLYALKGLASPATYTLAFTAPGFEQSDLQVFVDGGQAVVANTVQLQSGLGEIDGTVTDGSNPLGGVSVVASANGNTFTDARRPVPGRSGGSPCGCCRPRRHTCSPSATRGSGPRALPSTSARARSSTTSVWPWSAGRAQYQASSPGPAGHAWAASA